MDWSCSTGCWISKIDGGGGVVSVGVLLVNMWSFFQFGAWIMDVALVNRIEELIGV
jgi:hypothetical protein